MTEIKLQDHLCFKLYVASRLIMRGYGERLKPIDLTYPKYLVLLALREQNGQTVGSLTELLSLDFGTLSPLLKSLEKGGMISRMRHPDDDRTVVNRLTPKGRATLRKATHVAWELFCETRMEVESLIALRDQMDDYIGRCQTILQSAGTPTRAPTGRQTGKPAKTDKPTQRRKAKPKDDRHAPNQ